ncbi:hypothetical protein KPH14_009911 [Odynerus spinipes]|uniref:Vitellogenin domain-containing protein n=1 Tax=Odynerus spinipes TaxID=1348599 RepID=A0AAD9RSL4_9HYME|nr:hypothetical protein KPH14_009911 [Odynerus spinipes]
MDAVVIPYFLALTSLSAIVNDTETRNEPIYTYAVEVDFSRSSERDFQPDYALNLASSLRCQARNASVLSCILENRKMALFNFKRHTGFERIQTGKEFFEIDYNEAGVESLRVSTTASTTSSDKRYGLIKTIASQLNVGTDFGKHKSLAFSSKEISTFGECETLFTVSTFPCEENARRKNLQMRTVLYESLGGSIILRKRRNIEKCDRPNDVSLIENDESVLATVTSSFSEMHFCRDSFESLTVIEGKAVTLNEEARASVFRQTVKVRLEDVGRAVEEFPSFTEDTATDTIYLHKDVDNNDLDT